VIYFDLWLKCYYLISFVLFSPEKTVSPSRGHCTRRLDSAITPFRFAAHCRLFSSFFFFPPFVRFHYSNFFSLPPTTRRRRVYTIAYLRGVFDTRVISILFRAHARAHSHHIILDVAHVGTYRQTRAHLHNIIFYYIIFVRCIVIGLCCAEYELIENTARNLLQVF